jgi:hypothetical protein
VGPCIRASGSLGRQVKGNGLMLKVPFMCAIAKGFGPGHAAAAKRNRCAAPQVINLPGLVYNFKIPFYAERAVVVNGDLRACHNVCIVCFKAIKIRHSARMLAADLNAVKTFSLRRL